MLSKVLPFLADRESFSGNSELTFPEFSNLGTEELTLQEGWDFALNLSPCQR